MKFRMTTKPTSFPSFFFAILIIDQRDPNQWDRFANGLAKNLRRKFRNFPLSPISRISRGGETIIRPEIFSEAVPDTKSKQRRCMLKVCTIVASVWRRFVC